MTIKQLIESTKRWLDAWSDFRDIHWECGELREHKEEVEKQKLILEIAEKAEKHRWHDLRKNPDDLPETDHSVFLQIEFAKSFPVVFRAVYMHKHCFEVSGEMWETSSEYNEEDDLYYAEEGWYEEVMNWGDYQYCKIDDRANVIAWREIETF